MTTTFDPPGRRYTFGWGSSSRKLTGPAVAFRQGRRAIEREFEQAPADIGPRLQWLPIGASTTIGSARRSLDLAARCQDARSPALRGKPAGPNVETAAPLPRHGRLRRLIRRRFNLIGG
jgi:hypothetical protein